MLLTILFFHPYLKYCMDQQRILTMKTEKRDLSYDSNTIHIELDNLLAERPGGTSCRPLHPLLLEYFLSFHISYENFLT